jgi:Mrp family chromosome partitioning ATPase/uncharacterized protein involved in exopolysaccharide biosynthesis
MSANELHVTSREPSGSAPVDAGPEGAPAGASPWQALHRRLRGRYAWAVLLATAGLVGGAYLGWHAKKPLYAGHSLIYIQPSMVSPKDPTGTSVLPMFQGFVAYQVDLLKDSRLTEAAMETDIWKRTGRPAGPAAVADFEKHRLVEHASGTQHIQVLFLDPDPDVALAGVRAITQAYQVRAAELYDPNDQLAYARKQIEVLNSQIKNGTDGILDDTSKYGGVEGMEIQHRAVVKQVLDTEELLKQVQRLVDDAKGRQEDAGNAKPVPPEQIAVENPEMAGALHELDLLETQAQYMGRTLGARNPELDRLQGKIAVQKRRIQQLAEAWNQVHVVKEDGGASLEELKSREQVLADQLKQLQKRQKALGTTRGEVERLKANNEDLLRQRTEMVALKDQLTAQLAGKGRIQVPADFARPTAYYKDRRVTYAGAFGFLGALAGLLLVVLVSLRDRRLRDAGDLEHALSRVRLLGLLPSIPKDLGNEDDQHLAAHCVHQIRTFLQIGHARAGGTCICVSGPGVGSGKTTLAAALGLSFGNSGTRTLLVDADLSGRGLTWRVSRMLLGHARGLLARAGDTGREIVADRGSRARSLLESSLAHGSLTDWPEAQELGDLLAQGLEEFGLGRARESGFLEDVFALADLLFPEEVRTALASQVTAAVVAAGMLKREEAVAWVPARVLELAGRNAALNGSPLERYVYPTGQEGVSFMPLRGLGRGGEVSVATISKLLDRIRAEFDVALVDTGPVPGTVESSMVAAHADSVVLVMTPDDQRPDAQRAVVHMEEIGASVAGLVFNRAGQREILRSSLSRSSPGRRGPGA